MSKRASATKSILGVWLGDPHTGADHGLTLPKLAKTERQAWLAGIFQDITKRIRVEARGKRLHVHLGGDMVHLPGDDDTRELAEILFRPIIAMADVAAAVTGTEWHVGDDGSDDRAIYRGLGIPTKNITYGTAALEIGGRLVWWSHHGPKVGRRPHTELSAFHAVANDIYWRCLEVAERRPDAVIGHHVHKSPEPINHRRIWVATVPALALSDSFAAKVAPYDRPAIGALVYHPQTNGLETWTYAIPKKYIFG